MNTKKLFFFAIAALGLAACNNDEVVEVNKAVAEANTISFRPLTNKATRATEKMAFTSSDVINVWSTLGASSYFENINFTYDGTSFKSAANQTYYWPSSISNSNKVSFFATYGATQSAAGQLASATYDGETDVLFAKKEFEAKPSDGVGTLNFRHALSEIEVKAKNTNAGLEVSITGVRIGYVAKTASFSYTGGVTDQNTNDWKNAGSATLIVQNDWTKTTPSSPSTDVYEKTASVSMTLTGVQSSSNITGLTPWMLVPQSLALSTSPTNYTQKYKNGTKGSASSEANLNCAYIALKMAIKNNDASKTSIVSEQWCYWPITTSWDPGKKYTYVVDVAGGGYQPTNVDTAESDELDPVLKNLAIQFNPCTIDVWVTDLNANSTADDDIQVAN